MVGLMSYQQIACSSSMARSASPSDFCMLNVTFGQRWTQTWGVWQPSMMDVSKSAAHLKMLKKAKYLRSLDSKRIQFTRTILKVLWNLRKIALSTNVPVRVGRVNRLVHIHVFEHWIVGRSKRGNSKKWPETPAVLLTINHRSNPNANEHKEKEQTSHIGTRSLVYGPCGFGRKVAIALTRAIASA